MLLISEYLSVNVNMIALNCDTEDTYRGCFKCDSIGICVDASQSEWSNWISNSLVSFVAKQKQRLSYRSDGSSEEIFRWPALAAHMHNTSGTRLWRFLLTCRKFASTVPHNHLRQLQSSCKAKDTPGI